MQRIRNNEVLWFMAGGLLLLALLEACIYFHTL